MRPDIDDLRAWIIIVAIITTIGTNAVPIVYSFSPWRTRLLGRLFMYQALSFAFAMNVYIVLVVWRPQSVYFRFWVIALQLTPIAIATTAMAWKIWRLRNPKTNNPKGRHKMLFTDSVYNKLKFIALVVLPALAALYFGVSKIWGLPNTEEVMGTIALIDTFLGSLIKWSTNTYNSGAISQPRKYDGLAVVEQTETGSQLRIYDIDYQAVTKKDELLIKLAPPS